MSGYDAYISFANYLKGALEGAGITVALEKTDNLVEPYIVLQDGPDDIDGWLSARMIQGWLIVRKEEDKPLAVTMGEVLKQVMAVTLDLGHMPKYDYSTDPETQSGTYIPKIFEVTGPMKSGDPEVEKRVLTWELFSNSK